MALASSSHAFSYDVFLSFCGKDTRHGFTGYLYEALCRKGIHTFFDDEKLRSGEEITPALETAIKKTKIAIVVLSENYASSSFCLFELATIIDCQNKGMLVKPVFYKVDPCDVRYHKGSYGQAMTKHEERFQHNPEKLEKLQKWKMALSEVADLSGYHFKEGDVYEYKFTESIVDRVLDEINHPARLSGPDHLVGLESPKAEVMKLLDVESDDGIRVVGIHGMGGIGKSTLARVVYNDLLAKKKFDGSCYLENMREESNRHGGLTHLQSILLQKILRDKNINVTSVKEGASMIEDRLQGKKVLLLLDDVDEDEQLKEIVRKPKWFAQGSRIIITTRNKQLLTSHWVKQTYEVEELNENDARQLLAWKAFENGKVDPTYEEVLNRVLAYASGLPLALEVIGSHLCGKDIKIWESVINRYKRSPCNKIQNILQVSLDALDDEEQSVFLDIVCCMKGYQLQEVEVMLCALYGDNMISQIEELVDKSLIKINKFHGEEKVGVHDLIQDMGRQIEQEKSPKKLGKRRRLWLPKQIFEVLEDNTGTREIEIIYLDVPIADKGETIEWDGNAFKKMKNLKILIIKNGQFSVGPKCLPDSLSVLEWWGYPSHCLPSDFHLENLAICKLPQSRFLSLEFGCSSKMFMNLTALNFDWCEHLTRISDVSSCPNLEKLSFVCCPNLVAVHESIGFLDRLQELNAFGCSKLESFPPIHLTSLRKLELSYCSSLESFPEILGKMENIRTLTLRGTLIKEWPMSMSCQYLIGLRILILNGLGIGQLLSRIAMMPRLRGIEASDCKWGQWVEQEEDEENVVGSKVSLKLTYLCARSSNLNDDFFQKIGFTSFDRIETLGLSMNNFTILPECIKEFQSLYCLDVSNCKHLQEIKGVPPNLNTFYATNCKSLSSLSTSMLIKQELYKARMMKSIGMRRCSLPGACVPEWFDHISRGPSTSFWFRNNFPHKVLSLLISPVKCDNHKLDYPQPIVSINGNVCKPDCYYNKERRTEMGMDHTYISDLADKWRFEEPLENEWNHVEVTYAGVIDPSIIKATGIHLFKKESNNEDIQFTDPHSKKTKSDCDLNNSQSQIHPLLKKRRFAIQKLKFHGYNLCMNGKKKRKKNKKLVTSCGA